MKIERLTARGVDLVPVESCLVTSFRTLFLDKVDKEEVNELTQCLIYLLEADEEKNKPVILFVRADVGSIDHALTLIDYLSSYEDRIVMIAQGVLGFAASLVFASGKKRYALRHSSFCLYDAAAFFGDRKGMPLGFDGQMGFDNRVISVLEKSTGMSAGEIKKIRERMEINEAKEKGVLDEVLVSVSDVFKKISRENVYTEEG